MLRKYPYYPHDKTILVQRSDDCLFVKNECVITYMTLKEFDKFVKKLTRNYQSVTVTWVESVF